MVHHKCYFVLNFQLKTSCCIFSFMIGFEYDIDNGDITFKKTKHFIMIRWKKNSNFILLWNTNDDFEYNWLYSSSYFTGFWIQSTNCSRFFPKHVINGFFSKKILLLTNLFYLLQEGTITNTENFVKLACKIVKFQIKIMK